MSEAKTQGKAPRKAPAKKSQTFTMKRSGTTEGKSGKAYSHVAGEVLEVPAGEFAHLDAKTCEEKK